MKNIRNGGLYLYSAALLISTGLGILAWQELKYSFVSAEQVTTPLPAHQSTSDAHPISGKPVRLSIESLGIDLPVQNGTYDSNTQTWSLSDTSLFINTFTANGTVSNTTQTPVPLIYGHNYPKLLGKTRNIQINTELVVVTEQNERIDYIYIRSAKLKPTDQWILNYAGSEDLLLMTCEGTWDENRKIMFFKVKKDQS